MNTSGATFSPCETYRYRLWRSWGGLDESKFVVFIGLNPSTADETKDDPTIRRLIGFAKDWGFPGMIMLNLFAYRATDPKTMKAADDPNGAENDATINLIATAAPKVVCCWGSHGSMNGRGKAVEDALRTQRPIHHFGRNKNGEPKHPLYLPKTAKLIEEHRR